MRTLDAVLKYLAEAEAKEVNPHLADAIRLAWQVVFYTSAGYSLPFEYAFAQKYGKSYCKALKAWAERDEINRKALERTAEMIRHATERPAAKLYEDCREALKKPPRRAA